MSRHHGSDELVPLDGAALDVTPVGEEFRGADYYLLALLGLVLPIALLVWGWM